MSSSSIPPPWCMRDPGERRRRGRDLPSTAVVSEAGESMVLVGGGGHEGGLASDRDLEGILNAVGIDFPASSSSTAAMGTATHSLTTALVPSWLLPLQPPPPPPPSHTPRRLYHILIPSSSLSPLRHARPRLLLLSHGAIHTLLLALPLPPGLGRLAGHGAASGDGGRGQQAQADGAVFGGLHRPHQHQQEGRRRLLALPPLRGERHALGCQEGRQQQRR